MANAESIDFVEIELDPPDEIDLPQDFNMGNNNQNDLDLVPDEIDFPDFDNELASDNDSSSSDPTPNLDDYKMDVEPDNTNHQLPCYNITNFPMTNLENDDPALLLLNENNHYNGLEYESNDSRPAYSPFLETCRTPIEDPNGNPEVFSMSYLMNACGLLLHKPQTLMHDPKLIHQLEIGVLIQLIQITKTLLLEYMD